MGQGDAYFVDVEVPLAALLDSMPTAPTAAAAPATRSPTKCGAVWYQALAGSTTQDNDHAIQSWTPQEGLGVIAHPAKPNVTGTKLHPAGGIGFDMAVNTGLVAEGALSETEQFTIAVRFDSPIGDARSLVTVNPVDADNYLFLSEKDGQLYWQDQQGTVEVTLPSPASPAWVVVGYDHGRLSIVAAHEGHPLPGPTTSAAQNPQLDGELSGSSDLFIGCRSHRKGILKTLGQSQIKDVMVWADSFVLTPADADMLSATCRFAETEGQSS